MSDEVIEKHRNSKVVTEIKQDGNAFVITRIRPDKTLSNRLVLGQENEVETMLGAKIKVRIDIVSLTSYRQLYKLSKSFLVHLKLKFFFIISGDL